MNKKFFFEKFAEAIEMEDYSNLDDSTKFRDLKDWNSLAGLSIIAMFDEEFGKDISIPDFKNAITLEDLYKLVL